VFQGVSGQDDDVQRRCSLKTFSQFELFEPGDKQPARQGEECKL